jgi:hypothetical protein
MTTAHCDASLSAWLEQLKSTMTRKVAIVLSTQPVSLVDCMIMVVPTRNEAVERANQPLRMHIAKPRPCTGASPLQFTPGGLGRLR